MDNRSRGVCEAGDDRGRGVLTHRGDGGGPVSLTTAKVTAKSPLPQPGGDRSPSVVGRPTVPERLIRRSGVLTTERFV